MITRDMTAEKFKFVIKAHNYDVERICNMSTVRDTRRVAYVLGVVRSTKNKRQLWEEIVKKVKEEE